MTKNLTITVFGGSGFLGSHVSDKLSQLGHKVRIFDLIKSPWLRNDQKMIIGDLLDFESVKKATKGASIVYNFAAVSDMDEAITQPIQTMSVNILGNANVLQSCKLNKIKRFIYASTVYVSSREGSFYKISKQASEQLVREYQKLYNLNYTILRYGSIYGPRSDEHNGLYRIVKNAIRYKAIRYEGHPESLRDYVHVDDVASASVDVLGKAFCNEDIVLTGQESMRVYDMLKMLAEIMDISEQIEFKKTLRSGHYVRTPYSYEKKISKKYIPSLHVDLGQGLVQLIKEVQKKL